MCLTKLSNITVVIFGKHRWTVSIINIRKEGIRLDLEYTTLDNSQQSGGAWWLVTNVQYAECGHWSAVWRSGLQLHTVTRSHATSHHLILFLPTICFDRKKWMHESVGLPHWRLWTQSKCKKRNIPYGQLSAKLPVILSPSHLIIWSFSHLVFLLSHTLRRTNRHHYNL